MALEMGCGDVLRVADGYWVVGYKGGCYCNLCDVRRAAFSLL